MSWILGGVVLKAALYGIYTLCFLPFRTVPNSSLFLLVFFLGLFIPLLQAVTEMHLKRMVAFFSISHMSFAVMLISVLNDNMDLEELSLVVCGLVLGTLHTFISNMLFWLVDIFHTLTKTKSLLNFPGIIARPWVALMMLVFMLDNVGAMPFSFNFLVEVHSTLLLFMSTANPMMAICAALYLFVSPVVGLSQLLRYWRQYKTMEQESINSTYQVGPMTFDLVFVFSLCYCIFLFEVGNVLFDLLYLDLCIFF